MLPMINSNDSWTQLEEVWLGDVYPHEFYAHLEPQVRDVFYRITDMTREDLLIIENRLRDFGVEVRRPIYTRIEDHIDANGHLNKPEINPRDYYVVVGNDLVVPEWVRSARQDGYWCWNHAVIDYESDPGSRLQYHNIPLQINGANCVRVGKDLFLDCVFETKNRSQHNLKQTFHEHVVPFFADRRCHYLDNGGHVDGCFAILRPELILANHYFEDYDTTFPGWQTLLRSTPEFATDRRRQGPLGNLKWWLPEGLNNRAFNDHVIKHAMDWIGDYTETFFEVNCLVINPENVMMLGHNQNLFDHLASLGITAHSMPFRCRTFWDGGLHCLTLDIRRQGGVVDYFGDKTVDITTRRS
jgi:N-dimethylarginine dimethylaminohydrolase